MSDQVRHKTFISYHGDDHEEVEKFIKTFDHRRGCLHSEGAR